jgi:predicted DNA-binding transcriptional regulator AlpA
MTRGKIMETNVKGHMVRPPFDSHGPSLEPNELSNEAATDSKDDLTARTRLLTVGQVPNLLHVPRSWVYGHTRRRAQDRIPGFRFGKYWRFVEAELLEWVQRQKG